MLAPVAIYLAVKAKYTHSRWQTWAGRVWASPNTVIGILIGLLNANLPQNNEGRTIDIFLTRGPVRSICEWLGIHAFTVGDCVLWRVTPTPCLRLHEERHIFQYHVLGPFFLPVYFALLLIFGYWNHPLEKDARRASQIPGGVFRSTSNSQQH